MRRALLLLLLAASLPVAPAPAESGQPCDRLVDVHAVGPACVVPGGYLVRIGSEWRFTHGPDTVPANRISTVPFSKARRPSCATRPSVEFHARVLYVRPADRRDNFAKMSTQVIKMVEQVNGWLYTEASRFGRKLDLRVLCSGGRISIKRVTVPTPLAQTSFSSVSNDLVQQGYANPLAKYLIWFDGRFKGAPGGQGTFANSDTPNASNRSNAGAEYAIVWGVPGTAGASTMMHENGHNMGAVSTSAPRTTGIGHCIDGADVMCYRDGGPYQSRYRDTRCSYEAYDCGKDDYFNPRPRSGSYLSTHWNIGSPVNRFVAGCMYRNDMLRAPFPADDPEMRIAQADDELPADARPDPLGIFSRGHSVSSSCWGRSYAASAIIMPPTSHVDSGQPLVNGLAGTGFGLASPLAATDVDVCWYKRSALLRCASAGTYEKGTVPKGATAVRVILRGPGPAVYALNVV